jgi:hypothetical protein
MEQNDTHKSTKQYLCYSIVIEEKKKSGRMIRFIQREDYILLLLHRPPFSLALSLLLSTPDATCRASKHANGHMYIRLYRASMCIQKASKVHEEQKKVKSPFHYRQR